MKDKNTLGGILLVALSATVIGFMPIFAKTAYATGTSTYTLLFLRFLIAASAMFLLIFLRKLKMPTKKEMLLYLLLGVAGDAGQSYCYFAALNHTSSGVVSLLLYTSPAMVMVVSVLWLKEKFTVQKGIALCLALIGSAVIIGAEFDANPTGIILSVLSAVFYTAHIVLGAKVIKEGEELQASAFVMLGSASVFGILNLFTGFTPPTQLSGFVSIGMVALVSTAVGFWSFYVGIKKTGASTASLVATLEPVVTVFSSAIILSETLTKNTVIGGCLVIAALIITALGSKSDGQRSVGTAT